MEIDLDYHKAPKFNTKMSRYLPFVIKQEPIEVTKEYLVEEEGYYEIVNDNLLKEEKPTGKDSYKEYIYIYMGIWVIMTIITPILNIIRKGELMELKYYLIVFVVFSPLLYLSYNSYKKYLKSPEKKHVTFNRENGLLTMPRCDENVYFTIPFQHLKATRRRIAQTKFNVSGIELQFFNETQPAKLGRIEYISMCYAPIEPWAKWSLYVWYMDKNRPLPPGEVFDPYRQADFERRKAEGFPPPLYKSCIPTPEATAEQQLIRDTFWKDADHMPTESEAAYSLNPFDKNYKGVAGSEKV